ncbi:glycosyltransferase family 9 protein [Alphaproteobacteria bacterium]|nr:glycosyltransferase family 9 protein [Alphaproteobacteria bacterium]
MKKFCLNRMKKKILIIKHGALGDLVFAMGAFQAIRTHHKNDTVILLTSSPFKKLSERCPYFDEVWIDDRPRLWRNPLACIKLFQRLKKARFDLVYDLQRSKRTKWYLKVMKRWSPAPKWSSIHKGADFHYDIPSVYVDHIVTINKKQVQKAGIKKVPAPSLDWMTSDISALKLPKKYFILVPGTSPGQDHKKWPAVSYGIIAQRLVEKGFTPVVLGTQTEQPDWKVIHKACPQAMSLLGKTTLFDIPEIARKARGALGNDTGPMHFCYFRGCPSLYLFSHSSGPDLCGPQDGISKVIQQHNLADLSVETVWNHLVFRK